MQANHMKGDNFLNNHIHLFNRAILYSSSLYVNSVKRRSEPIRELFNESNEASEKTVQTNNQDKLPPYDSINQPNVYNLWFCDFTIFDKYPETYVHPTYFYTPTVDRESNQINIMFVELTKLVHLTKKPLSALSEVDKACLYIKYLNSSAYPKLITKIADDNEVLGMVRDNFNKFLQDEADLYNDFYALRELMAELEAKEDSEEVANARKIAAKAEEEKAKAEEEKAKAEERAAKLEEEKAKLEEEKAKLKEEKAKAEKGKESDRQRIESLEAALAKFKAKQE
jgi:chemotaxis protein histidine kinase CheA